MPRNIVKMFQGQCEPLCWSKIWKLPAQMALTYWCLDIEGVHGGTGVRGYHNTGGLRLIAV